MILGMVAVNTAGEIKYYYLLLWHDMHSMTASSSEKILAHAPCSMFDKSYS